MSISVKVQHGDEIRRVPVSRETSWEELAQTVGGLFSLRPASFLLKYTDSDGDLITLSTDLEIANLIAHLPPNAPLRLHVSLLPAASSPAPAPVVTATATPARSTTLQVVEDPVLPAASDAQEVETPHEEGSLSGDLPSHGAEEEEETRTTEPDLQHRHDAEDEDQQADEGHTEGEASRTQEQKGKEKEGKKVTLEDILHGFEQLRTDVEEIFNQHPEIEERASVLQEQLAHLVQQEFEERRNRWIEARRREHLLWRERFAAEIKARHDATATAAAAAATARGCQGFQRCPVASEGFCGGAQRQERQRACRGSGEGVVQGKLRQLAEMGFIDQELNLQILRRNLGDLHETLNDLTAIASASAASVWSR